MICYIEVSFIDSDLLYRGLTVHVLSTCFFFRAYERKIDEEAARRHFIRVKKSQIQKDITENQFQQHLIKMVCKHYCTKSNQIQMNRML